MPQLSYSCELCGRRWDGTVLTEYPSLRFCNLCLTRCCVNAIELLGENVFRDLIEADGFNVTHLFADGFYHNIRTGGRFIGKGYAHDFDAQARRTPDSSLAIRLRSLATAGDSGGDSPTRAWSQADQLDSFPAVQAEGHDGS